jgi:hypothetical protein
MERLSTAQKQRGGVTGTCLLLWRVENRVVVVNWPVEFVSLDQGPVVTGV